MWGGRFSEKPADLMQAINVSIGVDKRLWRQDLAGSRAHCRMLARQGIIRSEDAEAILGGLDQIEAERPDCGAWLQPLRKLAQGFDFDRMTPWIQDAIARSQPA